MERNTLQIAIVMAILIGSATVIGMFWFNTTNESSSSLNFYVLGDSQGYNGGLAQVVTSANENQPDFVFHCGDLTPFGQENQYADVIDVIDDLSVPFYTTAGNHDIRLGGNHRYEMLFGPSTYSFDFGPAHFSVINTSTGTISDQELTWLEDNLVQSSAEWKVVFTHIPPFDPRQGENHTLHDQSAGERLMSILESNGVNAFFAGHIHMFNLTTLNGVLYAISGGAGISLYADTDSGGIYHYLNVTINSEGILVEPVLLETPVLQRDTITIQGSDESVTLSIQDLKNLPTIEEFSSFQNQYDNWRGQGVYHGVKISVLLELIGGIASNQRLRVSAIDGFSQDFAYCNIYPNTTWYEYQGDMILAFAFNESIVPDWSNGLRIVMIPEDGGYSNDDCAATSAAGMGYNVYPSAGARWIRFIVLMEVTDE